MTILDSDIKLMASERLADTDDGGGMMSAVEVQDGVVNNLFPDISRLDRTYGRVNLRKAYAAVRTANQDIYYGSHSIITDAPDDAKVSVIMFTTDSYTDERADAQDHIESYVVEGPESSYVLLGDQLAGQRTLKLYSRVDAQLPEVGQVYLLSEEDNDGEIVGEQQYVRIDSVEHEIQEFEDDKGVFERRVYTLGIGSSLRRTFPGPDTAVRYSSHNSPTLFRSTQVADASRYYGIVALDEQITPGDMTIKAASIYGQLVPSATVESPVVDVQAGVDRANIVASGDAYSVNGDPGDNEPSFGRPVAIGSVTVQYQRTSGSTYWTAQDDGSGNLIDVDTGTSRGTIDYESGVAVLESIVSSYRYQITATPATLIYDTAHTAAEKIELANRGYNYVRTLSPIPQPGTLFVDYMAQGEWYRMQDNGKGVLEDEYGGTGTVDYTTGSVVATLGALPDTGSQIIYTWATPVHYEIRTDAISADPAYFEFTVSQESILPGSLSITWEVDGVTKTATDNGAGSLTGDATGTVVYGLGQVGLQPNMVPDSDAALSVSYQIGTRHTETPTYSITGDDASFTVSETPIKPGTFAATFTQNVEWDDSWEGTTANTGQYTITAVDNGDGTLTMKGPSTFIDAGNSLGSGTINYTTGQVVLTANATTTRTKEGWTYYVHTETKEWYEYDMTETRTITGLISVSYDEDTTTQIDQTESLSFPNASVNLTPTTDRQIVPGSLEFVWNSKTCIDREGTLYTDWDRNSGAATAIGTINYATGLASFDDYTGGGDNSVQLKTMLTKVGEWTAYDLYFRTPGAPLRPSSFYLRATKPDGTVVTGTPDGQGVISNNDMTGSIDYETGVVDVQFGRYMLDSELTSDQRSQPWYDPADILEDGTIWVPAPVDPGTMKFNAVVYSNMPLDASILGLDPVRLPLDGRVPIIRSGDVIVIHSTQSEQLPNPLSAGATITLGESKLASCTLADATGEAVDAALYSVDREAGTITLADPLDLSAYTQPLVATWRIEDMALVNEAQINGQLSLVGAIDRTYDPATTWVSSALIHGDLGSRVHHLFSQTSWTGEWDDERIGSNTTAQYNDLLYPIQVDNQNAIRERWAIIFTTSTTFNVVGEVSGQIATGNTTTDCAPINPITGEPYFTIMADGWGSGWSSGNVLRFNTDAAHAPIWIARTTVSGTASTEDDSFKLQIRGDAD